MNSFHQVFKKVFRMKLILINLCFLIVITILIYPITTYAGSKRHIVLDEYNMQLIYKITKSEIPCSLYYQKVYSRDDSSSIAKAFNNLYDFLTFSKNPYTPYINLVKEAKELLKEMDVDKKIIGMDNMQLIKNYRDRKEYVQVFESFIKTWGYGKSASPLDLRNFLKLVDVFDKVYSCGVTPVNDFVPSKGATISHIDDIFTYMSFFINSSINDFSKLGESFIDIKKAKNTKYARYSVGSSTSRFSDYRYKNDLDWWKKRRKDWGTFLFRASFVPATDSSSSCK